jgi:iron-sulfur cluster repair protein YtfE (RIC family)
MSDEDLALMNVLHDAFRRDVERLARAAARAGSDGPEARAALLLGWHGFKRELHHHHQIEDTHIWPLMRRKLVDRPDEVAVLDAMEAEHTLIDPALEAVDSALTDPQGERGELADRVDDLAGILHSHLSHEERAALPLIKQTITAREWSSLNRSSMRGMSYRWISELVPWVVDGLPEPRQDIALRAIPAPMRLLHRYRWQPRYERQRRWE